MAGFHVSVNGRFSAVHRGLDETGAPKTKENAPFKGSYEKFFQWHPWLIDRSAGACRRSRREILSMLAKGCVYLPDRNKYQEALGVAGELAQHVWVKMPQLVDAAVLHEYGNVVVVHVGNAFGVIETLERSFVIEAQARP